MILDVGCGNFPRGTINLDVNKRNVKNFLLADAHFLPFIDNCFNVVYCSHVLEHCKRPYDVLEELCRVSSNKVIVKVPNLGLWDIFDSSHLYSWNRQSFKQFLELSLSSVEIHLGVHAFSIRRHRNIIDYFISLVLLNLRKNELIGVGRKCMHACGCK